MIYTMVYEFDDDSATQV